MKIDKQNELTTKPLEQHQEMTSSWEGKDVSNKPVQAETTKKSTTVFGKVKNFMKAAWRNKYKILLATLGVITFGAAVTGASVLIAKKVNRKALPQMKPNDGQGDTSEVKETKDEEVKSPKLTHLTLDRPVREGIRQPTQHKPYEQLLNEEKQVDEEVAVITDQKNDQDDDLSTLPDSDDQLVKVEKEHIETSDDKDQEISKESQEQVHEEKEAVVQKDLEVKEPVIIDVADDEDSVLEQFIIEAVIADSEKTQEHHPVNKAQLSPQQKAVRRRQIHERNKLNKKLNKYKKKVVAHPKSRAKYNHKIVQTEQKLSALCK